MDATDRPTRRPHLEITAAEDGYIVYDPTTDRVHHLNPTAAVILELCDGTRTDTDIAADVQSAYRLEQPPTRQVQSCLDDLRRESLVGGADS